MVGPWMLSEIDEILLDLNMVGPRMLWELQEVSANVNMVGPRVLWKTEGLLVITLTSLAHGCSGK